MKIFNREISPMKMIGGIGVIVGAFFGITNLVNWSKEQMLDDISGNWNLTYTIEQTSFNPYKGLQLGYTLFIEQNGKSLKGTGSKTLENNQVLATSARTPIEVSGTFDGKNIQLTLTEKGKMRESHGIIKLKITDNKKIFEGTFTTDAANSSGKCLMEVLK
jgi:hypothetical protein